MNHRRILALVTVLFVASATAFVSSALGHPTRAHAAVGATRAAPGKVRFGAASVVDPVHTYGEPDVKVAYDGTVYDSGPWGTGTQRSLWEQSTDGGRTFHILHTPAVHSPSESDSQIPGPGGGDTEISINRTNEVYYADLAALVQLKVASWDRSTHTMTVNTLHDPRQTFNGVDRQWFALWDPADQNATRTATGYTGPFPVNYLAYAEAAGATGCSPPVLGSCEAAQYSTDGTTYTNTTEAWPLSDDGPLAIDQETGTVFQAIGYGAHGVGVAIATRGADPADPSLLNVSEVKIAQLKPRQDVGALFPVIAEDAGRNLYVAWVAENAKATSKKSRSSWQIFYSYATAASNWTTWSAPVRLSRKPANTNLMPWMTAGADGRIAVVWYGTRDRHNPSSKDVHQPWNVWLATVTNAASGARSIVQQQVTRHPMHYGSICLSGTGCITNNPPGNRNLADFFEVTTDPRTGALLITYDDTSNNLKQHDPSGSQAPPESVAHTGAPIVMMIRQNGGIGLNGTPIHGPAAVGTAMRDQKGDARFDPIYSNANIRPLDLRKVRVHLRNRHLVIRVTASALSGIQNAIRKTNAGAVDIVARWQSHGTKHVKGAEGTTNALRYAAAEFTPGGSPSFFAGLARSIELCSVSGCFPHIIEYPEPPYGGTAAAGTVHVTNGPRPDVLVLRIPVSAIGRPRLHNVLQDFGVYVLVRNKPASTPITNAEAQGGVTPIMVDGICCREMRLSR